MDCGLVNIGIDRVGILECKESYSWFSLSISTNKKYHRIHESSFRNITQTTKLKYGMVPIRHL